MNMVIAREEDLSEKHLCQNATNAPDIYSIAVFLPG
jgi:hypothetical protein